MSNSRNTGFLTNVIKVDATGNVSFVSGSTTLATISTSGQMSGSLPALSSSYALSASYVTNAETLDGLDSTVFTLTSSFNTTSASLYTVSSSAYDTSGSLSATSGSLSATSGSLSATSGSLSATSGSLSAASGSFNTRVTALEVTGSALSSSILSVSASSYLTSGSLSSASGSFDTRISTVESKYATTGSNTFIGTQIISGSILQSGSFTSTGTLTAQTLVVQTITSSVVYSSGSNIFGNSIGNSQVFTGSVLITGSLTIAGGSSATSYSGTTIYGSTAVCSAVGLFSGCVGIGTTSPGRTLHILGQTGIGTVLKLEGAAGTTTYLQLSYNGATNAQSGYIGYDSSANMPFFTNDTERLRITCDGYVAVTGNQGLKCVPYLQGMSFGWNRTNGQGESMINWTNAGGGTACDLVFNFRDSSTLYERLRIASTGAATFSSNIQVGGSAITGNSSAFYNTTTETSVAIKQTSGATYLALGLWNNDTTADSRFLRFFTEATATYRGSIQYDRPGNRLAIYGGGSGLFFDGASTFSSSLTIGASTALSWGPRGGITQDGSYNFTWGTNSIANAFYINSSNGLVGIGTVPNTVQLDVKNTQTGTMYPVAAFRDNSTNGNALQVQVGNGEARLRAVYYSGLTAMAMTFWTGDSSGAEAERMRITGGGTVQMGMMGLNTDKDYTRYGASTKVVDNAAVNLATMFPNVTITSALVGLKITAYAYSGGNQGTFEWLAVRAYNADTWTTCLIGSATTGITPTISFGGTNAAPTVTISSATYITAKYEIFSR